ncbi:MAG: class I SAM-dependent methyltransferase [Verrucomicrobiales bacterium]
MTSDPGCAETNRRTGKFYDLVGGLYPLVDPWITRGRSECIRRINREPPGRLLEIGVGPGRHLADITCHQIEAIDVSKVMVHSSQRRRPDARIRVMDGERTDFVSSSFDLVALFHVLSVTADPAALLREVHRLLRAGGRAYVLNRESLAASSMWIDRLWIPLARVVRLNPKFHMSRQPEFGLFRVLDRWRYGPLGLFSGLLLEK